MKLKVLFVMLQIWLCNSQSPDNAKEQCRISNGILLTKHVCKLSDYDKKEPPSTPTKVAAEIKLVDLSSLDEVRMRVSTKLTMTAYWNETRLLSVGNWSQDQYLRGAHSSIMDRIWLPRFYVTKLIALEGEHN